MGEAKRRQTEIAELKKKPRERKRVWRRLGKAKEEQVYHFRSEAARRAAFGDAYEEAVVGFPLRNSDDVTRAVKIGHIEQQFVQAIPLKIMTPTVTEKSAPPRQPHPFPLAVGAKGEELAHLVAAMANISPGGKGFRVHSLKAKNWRSTTLAEQLAIKFLKEKPNTFKRSERGEKKLELRNESKATALIDQLIARWTDRALQARHYEPMFNWFFNKVADAYPSVSTDWLQQEVKDHIKRGQDQKYWHAARRRAEQEKEEAA